MTDASIRPASNRMCWENQINPRWFSPSLCWWLLPPPSLLCRYVWFIYKSDFLLMDFVSVLCSHWMFSVFVFFPYLAGSSTGANPEEPDHVWIFSWAWCVRHQRSLPAGKLLPLFCPLFPWASMILTTSYLNIIDDWYWFCCRGCQVCFYYTRLRSFQKNQSLRTGFFWHRTSCFKDYDHN